MIGVLEKPGCLMICRNQRLRFSPLTALVLLLCIPFESVVAQCVDDDGDGWGWDGTSSCLIGEQATGGNQHVEAGSARADAAVGALNLHPAACAIEAGRNTCDVVAAFNVSGAGPHCLFEKSDQGDQNPRLLTCGNPTRIRVSVSADQSKLLELRAGSLQYSDSTFVDSGFVVGIGGVTQGNFELQNTRTSAPFVNDKASSLATSWDGRLHFDVVGTVNGKLVSVVRVLRAERMNNQGAQALQSPALFSSGHIFASDAMSAGEVSRSTVRVPGKLGMNEIGIDVPFNIAVYPNNRLSGNPYLSNASGAVDDFGEFETYRFYVVMGSNRAGTVTSEYDLINGTPSRGRKIFLTRFEASVVVRNPRTGGAEVHNVFIHSKAQPMRDVNSNLIYGYEPTATLDGRLIVYSGNSNPARRNGHGGEVNYIFNHDQHAINDWSRPAGLADMYYQHGPGSSAGETRVGPHGFSQHFPVAAQPLRQYNGEQLVQGDIVKGAYPWISPRGSEVFFMSRSTFHGADRSGGTMVGFRTHGQLRNLDSEVNNGRGNPTNSYNNFANGGGNQYSTLVRAYESRRYPGTNEVMGRNSWSNLFFRPLGQFPTSWSATAGTVVSPVPMNTFPESYGFWLTGNRYDEVTFPPYGKDLLAYYPMNEPVYQDQAMLRPHMNQQPGAPNPEAIRRFGINHVTDKTADLSANQHTATLRTGAQYPFEFYDVKTQWANSGVLKDQNEGALGNSIFFRRNGTVTAALGQQSIQKIADSQSITAGFWINTNTTDESTNLLTLDGVISVSLQGGQVRVAIEHDGAQQVFVANANLQVNQWQHLAVTWRLGTVSLYVNGRAVSRVAGQGDLTANGGNAAMLTLGPNGSGASNLLLKMDEVYLYATHLSDTDIETLSYRKRVYNRNNTGFFIVSGMANDYPSLPAGTDLSFNGNEAEIAAGATLFNTTELSRDNTISCASCHIASHDFTDGMTVSSGIGGITGQVNTPTLVNSLLSRDYFYSGAANSLEVQSIHTIMQHGEMGVEDARRIVDALPEPVINQLRSTYRVEPGLSEVARSLAAFVKTIRVRGNVDANRHSLSGPVLRGRQLFNGKANCVACHTGSNLTDNKFHDIGLNGSAPDQAVATGRQDDKFRRKTPTLRNTAHTAPYFHDGSAVDLAAVVRHYNNNSHMASGRVTDAMLHPLELSPGEINDLVEYLNTLSGPVVSGR